MKRSSVLLLLLALLVGPPCPSARADGGVTQLAVGLNGTWLNNTDGSTASDVEGGANASISVTPHLSGVVSGYRGFEHSYWVPQAGVRLALSDVDDRNFSLSISAEYRLSSSIVGPKEWLAAAEAGLRPWPKKFDHLVVGLGASYGVDSRNQRVILAARYGVKL